MPTPSTLQGTTLSTLEASRLSLASGPRTPQRLTRTGLGEQRGFPQRERPPRPSVGVCFGPSPRATLSLLPSTTPQTPGDWQDPGRTPSGSRGFSGRPRPESQPYVTRQTCPLHTLFPSTCGHTGPLLGELWACAQPPSPCRRKSRAGWASGAEAGRRRPRGTGQEADPSAVPPGRTLKSACARTRRGGTRGATLQRLWTRHQGRERVSALMLPGQGSRPREGTRLCDGRRPENAPGRTLLSLMRVSSASTRVLVCTFTHVFYSAC